MKKTKDDKLFEIESNEDMKLFKSIATGRKFFKKGERVIDICNQEIERYKYEHSNFIIRFFNKSKFKNKKEKYMIENRISNVVRAIAFVCIRNNQENEELDFEDISLSKEVKEYILKEVEEYEEKNPKNKSGS